MIRSFIGISLGVLVVILALMQTTYAAPDSAGHVVWVKGSFTASGRPLQKGSPIYVHDTLKTAAASMAEIVFTDTTLMTFKENTSYSVDAYHLKKDDKGNFAGTLTTGGFRTITGTIAKNNSDNYHINTPVATIGVRGTDYQAVMHGGYLYVVVYDGTVCMTPTGGAPPSPFCAPGLIQYLD